MAALAITDPIGRAPWRHRSSFKPVDWMRHPRLVATVPSSCLRTSSNVVLEHAKDADIVHDSNFLSLLYCDPNSSTWVPVIQWLFGEKRKLPITL